MVAHKTSALKPLQSKLSSAGMFSPPPNYKQREVRLGIEERLKKKTNKITD